MELIEPIRLYLRGNPSEWITISQILSESIARFYAPEELNNRDALELALLAALVDPQTLYTVVLARDEAEAQEMLADRIIEAIVETPVHFPDQNSDFVEWQEWRLPRENLPWWADPEDTKTVWSGYSVRQVALRQEEILSRIKRSLRTPDAVTSSAASVTLDVIDISVYRAISQHPELLRTIHWRTFERLLADILARFGYEVDLQRGSKDGGIDLFAVKRVGVMGPERYILQAKRWSHAVGVEPVRELLFLQSHHRATKACLATTARFTQGAWELAEQYRWQLALQDIDGLLNWVRDVERNRPPNSR